MSQDASQKDGGGERDEALESKRRTLGAQRSPNVIMLSHEQRKTAVDAGFILGDRLVQCLCWQKLREWGIIG